MKLVLANEATDTRRRVYFDLRDATDGITTEPGEAAGQPQISTNGASFTNTGIGTLTHIGNGRYYADLTQAAVATAGDHIETRFKSANTAESPGDSVLVVAFDPFDAAGLGMTNLPEVLSLANINAEMDSSIETYHLDHLLAVDYDPASQPGVATALLNELVGSNGGISRFTAGALELVWGVDATLQQTQGTFGQAIGDPIADPSTIWDLINTNLDATVSSRSDFDEATDPVELLDSGGTAGTSADELVDDVWDEVNTVGAHNTPNSTGRQLREGTGSSVLSSGTCAVGGQTTTNVRLAGAESSTDDIYRFQQLVLTGGTNAGFVVIVSNYDGSGKDCTVTPALPAPCDNTTTYNVVPGIVHAETQGGGYDNGAVWVDTVNGVAGTELYVNGTVDNPSNLVASAKLIADSLGLRVIHMLPGSSDTLAASYDSFEFVGEGYSIALGGQSVSGAVFQNATITGSDDGSNAAATVYRDCLIGSSTLGLHQMIRCGLSATITLAEEGAYDWVQCYSRLAGVASTPVLDFGAALNASSLNARLYSGGIEVQNMGAGTGSYAMSLEGYGQLIINANCGPTSTIAIRGHFPITDNSGTVTLVDESRFAVEQITGGNYALNTTALGNLGIDWASVENPGATVNLAATTTNLVNTTTANTDMRGTDSGFLAANAPTNFGVLAITAGTGLVDVNDKTGFAIGVGGLGSTAFATGAIDAAALNQDAAREIADEVLDRNLAGGGSGNTRNIRNALRALRNRVDVASGIVYQENDSSTAWTFTKTTDALAEPITEINPAGP